MSRLLLFVLLLSGACFSQAREQQADLTQQIAVQSPSFTQGTGPRVGIDEAHFNFHTLAGRYAPFAALLRADGYRVSAWRDTFTAEGLAGLDILVVANALHKSAAKNWAAPAQSAFSPAEVAALKKWVQSGGSLLLIADHQPFPAAAAALAREFGFLFYNGYVLDPSLAKDQGLITFSIADGTLHQHPVVSGAGERQSVASVSLFTGQALLAPDAAMPLLELSRPHYLFLPGPDRKISNDTTRISVESWLQGATLNVGKGRIAVFGEAAGFTAQNTRKGGKMGMNHPRASGNAQFVLNVMHWLQQR